VLALANSEVEIVLFNLKEENERLRQEIYNFFGNTIIKKMDIFDKLL
jgi:uncharacterized membrane protein